MSGSRWREQPGHHNKPGRNGGVFTKLVVSYSARFIEKSSVKTVEKDFTLVASTILYTGV